MASKYVSEKCCKCSLPTDGIFIRFEPSLCLDLTLHKDVSRWTHALCDDCWNKDNPDKTALRMLHLEG